MSYQAQVLSDFCCAAYDDLVVPLKNSCPEALNAANNAGVTPEDLLTKMKHKKVKNRINRVNGSSGF